MRAKWMKRLSGVYAVHSLIILSAISTLLVVYHSDYLLKKSSDVFQKHGEFEQFSVDWCRVRRFERDWQMIIAPCKDQLSWDQRQAGSALRTDPNTSFISSWDLKPAGQFSRFFIQSVDMHGQPKRIGGDFWRITINQGPSSIAPFVFDLQNGQYEVLFLVLEPGNYSTVIYLDYTLCDGLREPPSDWFIRGNYQGKLQRDGTLGDISQDYIMQLLNKTDKFNFSIAHSPFTVDGYYKYFEYRKNISCGLKLSDISCGQRCKKLWDGHGRWVDKRWKRHVHGFLYDDFHTPRTQKNGTMLWMIGDSNIRQLYNQVVNGHFCERFFETCDHNYNWIYEVSPETFQQGISAKCDKKDFNETRVLTQLQDALDRPQMQNEDSVLLLNYGLHYSLTLNFSAYQNLISNVIRMVTEKELDEDGNMVNKLKARVLWKGSTHVEREKLYMMDKRWGSYHTTHWRFHTNQRHMWFNAYAMSKLCEAGIPVLELYPMTVAYPEGTADSVHFPEQFLIPIRNILADYFSFEAKKTIQPYNYYLRCT